MNDRLLPRWGTNWTGIPHLGTGVCLKVVYVVHTVTDASGAVVLPRKNRVAPKDYDLIV